MADLKTAILQAMRGGIGYYLRHLSELREPSTGTRCLNVRNPFYDDHKAALSVWQDGDIWLHKDHGDARYQGDMFAFGGHVHRLDPATEFGQLLQVMAKELGLSEADASRPLVISRNFSERSTGFWNHYGIGQEWLTRYGILQISHTLKEDKQRACADPTFAIRQGEAGCKVYQPKAEGSRFYHLGNKPKGWLFGEKQLSIKADLCLITGSEKDLLAGLANADALFPGKVVTGVALNSETAGLDAQLAAKLKPTYGIVALCFDTDDTGVRRANKLAKQHSLATIELPDGLAEHIDPLHKKPCKDLADYCALVQSGMWKGEATLLGNLVLPMAKTTPETVLEPVSKEDETAPKRVLRTSKERFSAFRTYAETLELERNELTDRLDSSEGVLDLNTLYVRAQNAGVGLSFEDIKRYCFSAELPSFNPIRRYFQRLPIWDEIDHIASLCHHIQVPDPTRLHTQLKKWLARALRQVFEPERFNKQMLVLVSSGQNPGKTTLLRWLIPTALAEHYCENPDIADKDARIAIARSLLVSFDEVAVLLRNRHAFKALISAGANTVRLPYTASPTRLERLASFVATSNEYDFIHDETGSVRYLCFEVASINHSYTNAVDINKLWAQAYALYKSNAPIDLTAEELRENALANDTFTTQPEAAELVRRYFRPCKARELPSHHLSATELKDILSERHAWFRTVPEVSLGKALRALLGPSKSQGDDGVKRYAMIKTASITW